jgi:hypothetical protein
LSDFKGEKMKRLIFIFCFGASCNTPWGALLLPYGLAGQAAGIAFQLVGLAGLVALLISTKK